jgi:hypothetical protein
MQKILENIMVFQSSDRFDGRPWVASQRVEGAAIDEVFEWANDSKIDIICQGVTQFFSYKTDQTNWCSVWSFNSSDDQLLFVLRFGTDIVIDIQLD